FYPQNMIKEFGLLPFKKGDMILATRKFYMVEYLNEKEPNNLLKFPALISIIAMVQEPPNINGEDAFMTVNYVYVKTISFSGHQKMLVNMDSSSKVP
ncbi:1248_t:CDS:2, partial [Scutellospora calospora]